jgi:hypothetical protein
MRQPIKICRSLLLAAALTPLPAWAVQPPSGPRITTPTPVQPPRLSVLARQLAMAEHDEQWEFAAITLDVLLDVYNTELQNSAAEKASTAARRKKLARWQRATRGLIDQIEIARLRLAQGGRFSLYVDPRHQILIIVEGQTVVVSGPHASADDRISAPVLAQFCAYNDCSILRTSPEQETRPELDLPGIWVLSQRSRPAYQIGSDLRCEFETLDERDRKADVCKRLSGELLQLAAALQQTASRAYAIDWAQLLKSRPGTRHPYLVLNSEGAYLGLQLDLLNKAGTDDWQDMLEWLRHKIDGRPGRLVIIRADQFLSD